MKNARHLPVLVLAIFCLCTGNKTQISAQSGSDMAYLDSGTPAKSSVTVKPEMGNTCLYQVAMRTIGTAGRYYQRQGWSEKFIAHAWEYHIVNGDGLNCFALSDGKIAVFNGLARFVSSSDQMAYIVGHAIGHVLSGHEPRNKRPVVPAQSPFKAQAWAGMENFEHMALGFGCVYRDKEEAEADRLSLTLMRLAVFDPKASLTFWDAVKQHCLDKGMAPVDKFIAWEARKKTLEALIPVILTQMHPLPQEKEEDNIPCADYFNIEKDSTAISNRSNLGNPITKLVPQTSVCLYVLVDILPTSGVHSGKLAAIEKMGTVYLDNFNFEGFDYCRVLLGDFSDRQKAISARDGIREKGFAKAEMVEYKNGKYSGVRY